MTKPVSVDALPPLKETKKRYARAAATKRQWQPIMDDIHEFILPWRQSTKSPLNGRATSQEGQPKMGRVFDSTAIRAAFRFPGRMQRDVCPPYQDFLAIEAGPMWPEGEEKKKLNEELERISKLVMGTLQSGDFDTAAHECFMEFQAGEFAMLVENGDDNSDPVDIMAVPMAECLFELDARGKRVTGVFRVRNYFVVDLPDLWPEGTFGESLLAKIEAGSADEVTVVQYTCRRKVGGRHIWQLLVWIEGAAEGDVGAAAYIHTKTYRTSPWITPRFYVLPGEVYGRGPAFIALPFTKTLNKAQELALMAAAYAVKPAWMSTDDAGLNPDTARLRPGAILKVSRTGGAMGASLARLPIPADFDISSFVIKDQREQVREAMFDAALPDPTGAVRSPTEIVNRMKALVEDLEGSYGRIIREFLMPLAARIIDILESRGLLNSNLSIDNLTTRIRVKSPLATAQKREKVRSMIEWIELQISLLGPQAPEVYAAIEDIVPEIGRMLGVEERFIRGKGAQEEKLKEQAERQQSAAMAEAQAKAVSAPQTQSMGEDMGVPLA